MAPHSSTLAWKIPWMDEPGGLQSLGLLRVRHDWTTSFSLFSFMHWKRKWQPIPVFLLGESQVEEPGGLLSMGSHRVGHNWSDLAAAAAAASPLTRRRPWWVSESLGSCLEWEDDPHLWGSQWDIQWNNVHPPPGTKLTWNNVSFFSLPFF